MEKTLILIGGGEIRQKETLEIDKYIASLAREHAGEKRPVALFIGTASHDFMPYYNSFHKVYTGELGLKTDVALTVFHEPDEEKLNGKFEKADVVYIGGGDTLFMLESWKQTGLYDKIKNAYDRGIPVAGLSAGAICWFEQMYTDSESKNGDEKYHVEQGLGLLKGGCCPHFDQRKEDFLSASPKGKWTCMENNSAVVYINEEEVKTIGNVHKL